MDENKDNNTPSTSSDVMPTGGGSIGQAAKQKVKNTARKGFDALKEAAGRGIKALWAILPLQVKIVVIVIIIILIVILAAMLMGMIEESTSVTNDSVDSYISSAKDLDSDTKSLYDEKASLIKLKISDINKMYDKFVSDDKGGTETQTLMQYKIGSNDVSADNRIVNIDDKLPVYKHIMMTEKYNFNSVKWYKYSHSSSSLAKKVDSFKEDKDLGLKYPDDSKNESGGDNPNPTKLEKFIDLTLSYLQTWYIPLAMSNASIINGKEEDSNRAPAFSYNIIKEAYSNIVVNWYELKKHTEVTQYHTYDKVERHDTLYNVIVNEVQKRSSGDGNSYDTLSYSVDLSNISKNVFEDSRIPHNTATNNGLANGTRNPMKEDLINKKDEYTSTYYIKEADVFDAKIVNEFNYQVYAESDVNKRINPDSSNETSAIWTRTGDQIENKFDGSSISYNNGVFIFNGSAASSTLQNTEILEGAIPGQSNDYRNVKRTYNITLANYYEYENGLEHTVTRVWKDKLSQTDSKSSFYTIDDLLKYNQSEDRNKTVSVMDLCGSSYSSSSSSGTSTGTSSPATEIKVGSYTYPVFNQKDFPYTTKHGGESIAQAGCGLCSLTAVVGGITGKKVDPVSCGNDTNWIKAKSIVEISNDLKNVYSIQTECYQWANKNDKNSVSDKINETKQKIKDSLNNNNPVIILIKEACYELGSSSAHYITLVGINGNTVTIANSAGGKKQEYDLDFVVPKMYNQADSTECGFIIAKRSGTTSSSESSTSTTISTSNGKSEDLKGRYSISKNGYDTIHKSRVTGRSYKLYLQGSGSPWAGETYQGGETIGAAGCGITSDAILCTGYGHDTTPKKINDSYNGYHVGQELEKAINNGVVSKDWTGFSVSSAIKHMQEGGTFIAHTYQQPYTSREHYMAVIDINESGDKIYVADPAGNYIGWQDSEEFFSKMDRMTPYGKDGGTGSYDGTATSGEESSSGSSTTCTGTESGKYYTNLKKTDGLNRIDFMNSNPDIMHRYIREGAEYLEYVGYSRSKLTLSYWNLKKLLQQVYEKNDCLPWAYGKTLGFENIYSSTGSSNSKLNGNGMFTWPVPEYVEAGISMQDQLTAHFAGDDSEHNGNHGAIDIQHSTNKAATIVAAAAGTVIVAENSTVGNTYEAKIRSYGNYVVIDHGNGYFTLYGHMQYNSIVVKTGDKVNKGQKIGIMGNTGYSTGPHLHFEVRQGESFNTAEKVDPEQFFNDDCSSVGGGSASQNLVDFVWNLEGSDEYLKSLGYLTSDGKSYIIFTDAYAGTRAVGHGIDLDAGGYASVLEKAGYPTSVGSKVPKDFIDKLSLDAMNTRRSEIESKVSGLNLKDYQIDALVSRSYQMGPAGWYDGDTLGGYMPGMTFNTACQKWWKDSDTKTEPDYNHPLYTNFMQYTREVPWRRKAEWKLFQTGVYDASH